MPRPSLPKSSPATATKGPVHRWAGLSITADCALPELPLAVGDAAHGPAWGVRRLAGRLPLARPRRWFHRWRLPDGGRWLSFARTPDGYLLRFNGLVDFALRPAERLIDGYCPSSLPQTTFNHLLLDQVLPLAVGGPECLALHASVVEVDGGAVAFLGASRQGKSTLAAAFARLGHTVLSDDCCVLRRHAGGFEVAPTYPGVRLFAESIREVLGGTELPLPAVSHYSSKRRVATAGHERSVPMRRFYTLIPPSDLTPGALVEILPRTAREGTLDLVGGTFYLDVADAGRTREGFELAAEAASSYGVRALTFPRNLATIGDLVARILEDLPR